MVQPYNYKAVFNTHVDDVYKPHRFALQYTLVTEGGRDIVSSGTHSQQFFFFKHLRSSLEAPCASSPTLFSFFFFFFSFVRTFITLPTADPLFFSPFFFQPFNKCAPPLSLSLSLSIHTHSGNTFEHTRRDILSTLIFFFPLFFLFFLVLSIIMLHSGNTFPKHTRRDILPTLFLFFFPFLSSLSILAIQSGSTFLLFFSYFSLFFSSHFFLSSLSILAIQSGNTFLEHTRRDILSAVSPSTAKHVQGHI